MKKSVIALILTAVMAVMCAMPAFAAANPLGPNPTGVSPNPTGSTFSSVWYQTNGVWHAKGPTGYMLTNVWLCDNAVAGGANNWYLIDGAGNMVTAPLVQDGTGHFYSLETRHDGVYGMLRYVSGVYDGVNLVFSQNHDGSFGAILNQDGISALASRYGVYSVANISNKNCVYTANYAGGGYAPTPSPSYDDSYTINYYVDGSKWKTKTKDSRHMTIMESTPSGDFRHWEEHSSGDVYYPGDTYDFSGSRTATRMDAVFGSEKRYTVRFMINGPLQETYKEYTQYNSSFKIPKNPPRYEGMPFKYWKDEYGNHWKQGEIFTAPSFYETLTAVYDSFIDGVNGGDD